MRITIESKYLLLGLFVICCSFSRAREAPAWMAHIVADEITDPGYIESQKVLDPYSISTVRITMDPGDYSRLINNTSSNEYLLADMTFESPTIPLQRIEQVGIRLRGAAARSSRKKSFKISFRAFGYDDREFYGLRKLNLNCDFQDIHLMRAKTCTDLFRQMGVPAARVGYAKFYINNDYRGLFANSEEIDKAFLRNYFVNNDGNLYKCRGGATMQNGAGGYELQTNEEVPDYSDILEFIHVLNNTPSDRFKQEIEKVFNVDEMLMYIACNVLLGAWDDYWVLVKNFYFYHDLLTDQFNYIPHDFDGSLGTDWYHGNVAYENVYTWSPNSGRPMVEKLLEVPEYRDRYTHYLMLLCMWPFSLEAMEPEIDRTADMIRETLTTDPYWGWNPSDFDKAFDTAISQGNVKYGMKEYIRLRQNSALQQLEQVGPFIKQISREPLLPKETDPIILSHLIVDRYDVSAVTLFYKTNNVISEIAMKDDGSGQDEKAHDFIYTALIPAETKTSYIQYYVQAENANGHKSRYPAKSEWVTVSINYEPPAILINEICAQNESANKDKRGEYDDWFELYNPSDQHVNLMGMYVSDNLSNPKKWRLGNLSIPSKGFLLLWADDDAEQGADHVGFKLSGEGEEIGLFDTDDNQNKPIDTLHFGPQMVDVSYGRTQDGADEWIFYNDPTPGRGNRDSTASYEDLIDITDFGGFITEPHNNSPANETIENIIDNNVETKYLTFNESTWIEYSLDYPSLVKGYAIFSANDVPERDPSNWVFQAFDDENSQWIILHTVSNEPQWPNRFQSKEFFFTNTKKYKKYRLDISSAHGVNIVQIAELEILGEMTVHINDITDKMGPVLEPYNDSPAGEEIDKIIDNNVQTKYLTFHESTWVEYRHTEPVVVTGYAITSANDAPARDPRTWQLQGWDHSTSTWITLHSVTDEPMWPARFYQKRFSFTNAKLFSRYRLDIKAGHGANIIQMAELEIYQTILTSADEMDIPEVPVDYSLAQNFPNPFNSSTRLQFSIPSGTHVKLFIHNIMGQKVKSLIDQQLEAGTHSVLWDATDDYGSPVANAVYLYTVQSELGIRTKKMVVLK
ncbi:CotH kinase family protein [candidate division KSB1 bacterium]|nr:CotH kinase family protein [candidate division KSB1 bacterium]